MFRLVPRPPFALEPALRFIKLNPGASGSTIVEPSGSVLHAARIGAFAVALSVSKGRGENSGLETLCCELKSSGEYAFSNDLDLSALASAYLDNYLSLSIDLSGFYAVAQRDKRFADELLPRLHGYHPVKFPTSLESVVWAVLSQATPQTIARKLMRSVASAYGTELNTGETSLTAFPAAQTLIDTPKGALRDLIANERKAKTIQAAAQALLTADPSWLRDAPTEYLESWLRELPGIGAWSASLILVRGFGRMNAITADSLAGAAGEAFLTAAKRIYGPRFTAIRLAAMLEKYGPYAGYWLHYLRAGLAR